jgi:DNA-directed RNA polymerase specialized sigma subunit
MDKTNTIPDCELVLKAKAGCSDSLLELYKRHAPLLTKVYNKYRFAMKSCGIEDYEESDKIFLMWKTAETFKADKKSKFSSWIGNYTRFYCLKKIAAHNRKIKFTNDYDIALAEIPASTKVSHLPGYVMHILNGLEDKRIKKIFELKYFHPKEYNFSEISKKIGIGNQRVSELHEKGRKILQNKLKSEKSLDVT